MTPSTSFDKKFARNDFRAIKWGIFSALLLGVFFLFAGSVEAFVYDDFDSYSTGDLTTQSDWYPFGISEAQVSDVISQSGDKSIVGDAGESSSYVLFDFTTTTATSTEGALMIWGYVEYNAGKHCEFFHYDIRPFDSINQFRFKNVDDAGTCKLYYSTNAGGGGASTYVEYGEVIYDEWFSLVIQWELVSGDIKGRYRRNSESWTDWTFGEYNHLYQFVDVVFLGLTYEADSDRYFDTLSSFEECDDDHCELCETYSTCIDASCSWYYSIFLQEYYCVDYFESDEEYCGSFFECQYCSTQELCEAELNCEWKDIGFGDRCYMIEPLYPPTTTAWEIPDLDDCETTTSTTAFWLCSIKNFIAGIFMPSQSKINDLYQTIGAFKEKFPFNYASEMSEFFSDISASTTEEKAIPITILGQESAIDFQFWNSTTSIGGVEETFKNVLIDFSSMIIFLGWFVWLISLIRRFF